MGCSPPPSTPLPASIGAGHHLPPQPHTLCVPPPSYTPTTTSQLISPPPLPFFFGGGGGL